MSLINSILTPVYFNIKSNDNEHEVIYFEQSISNLFQIVFLNTLNISACKQISNFKYISKYSLILLQFNLYIFLKFYHNLFQKYYLILKNYKNFQLMVNFHYKYFFCYKFIRKTNFVFHQFKII